MADLATSSSTDAAGRSAAPQERSTRAARAAMRAADLRESARALLAQADQVYRRAVQRPVVPGLALSARLSREELLDAGEDVEHLLDAYEELDLSPACRLLLLDLDDALTRASRLPAG